MNDIFNNSQALAKAVKDIASLNLFPRPYNRFVPDSKIWWLIPSKDWPAYKFGKLFFETIDEDIFCGYNIEKGVSTKDDSYHNSFQMNSEWFWYDFMTSLRKNDRDLMSILKKFASNKLKSHLVVSAGLVPTGNQYFNSARIEFEIDGNLELHRQKGKTVASGIEEKIAMDFISELQHETNISKLASKISEESSPYFDWLWIDVCFGVYIPPSKEDMTAVKLWKDYLKHWEPWLRKHEG